MPVFRPATEHTISRFRNLANDETAPLKVSFDGLEEGTEVSVQHCCACIVADISRNYLPELRIALASFPI
jgi:hypothetical protein